MYKLTAPATSQPNTRESPLQYALRPSSGIPKQFSSLNVALSLVYTALTIPPESIAGTKMRQIIPFCRDYSCNNMCVCVCMHLCVCVCVYTFVCVCVYVCVALNQLVIITTTKWLTVYMYSYYTYIFHHQ